MLAPRILALLLSCSPAMAQLADQETLRQRFDEKLASPFLELAPWITDFEEAKEAAADTDQLVFVYVSRSYEP